MRGLQSPDLENSAIAYLFWAVCRRWVAGAGPQIGETGPETVGPTEKNAMLVAKLSTARKSAGCASKLLL